MAGVRALIVGSGGEGRGGGVTCCGGCRGEEVTAGYPDPGSTSSPGMSSKLKLYRDGRDGKSKHMLKDLPGAASHWSVSPGFVRVAGRFPSA